jgi:hypothetical protein
MNKEILKQKLNKYSIIIIPITIVVSTILLIFVWKRNINSSYWMTVLVSILGLISLFVVEYRTSENNKIWFRSLLLLVLSIDVILIDTWATGSIRYPAMVIALALLVGIFITMIIYKYRGKFNRIKVSFDYIESPLKHIVSIFLTLLFTVYTLHPDSAKIMPASLQFNVIVISATLGGLVFAGSSNRRLSRQVSCKLIRIARYFILTTILFLVFTGLAFWVDATGGINIHITDFSQSGIFRGITFYLGIICFYVGIYLFSFALIDLATTLRKIKTR